jgi:hypothetical protein
MEATMEISAIEKINVTRMHADYYQNDQDCLFFLHPYYSIPQSWPPASPRIALTSVAT